MSRMYVANCTNQVQTIFYRLDFTDRGTENRNARFQAPRQQSVQPGRQIQLGSDFHVRQIEDIVSQLTPFGLIGTVDVPRQTGYAPLVFGLDRPISEDVLNNVKATNEGFLVEQGKLRRQRAAVVVNDAVQNRIKAELDAKGITDVGAPDSVQLTIEQQEQSENGESRIEEGYVIDKKAPPGKPRRGKR
jgi:hypothetical protein